MTSDDVFAFEKKLIQIFSFTFGKLKQTDIHSGKNLLVAVVLLCHCKITILVSLTLIVPKIDTVKQKGSENKSSKLPVFAIIS